MPKEPSRKLRFNQAQRRALTSAGLAAFLQKYGRKAQRGGIDPNDRGYDRDIERKIKTMDPIRLDRLLRDDED